MKLYVARHGKSVYNEQHKLSGRRDVPLAEEGIKQAHALAEKCMALGLDLILTSPLRRAKETANIVEAACGVPCLEEARLIEQDFGDYEGIQRSDDRELLWSEFAVRCPRGESVLDLAARIYPLLKELKEKYADKTVLLLCHGGVARVIRTYFYDMTNAEFTGRVLSNGEIEEYQL